MHLYPIMDARQDQHARFRVSEAMNNTENNGLISLTTDQSVAFTIQRIRQLLDEQGVNVFAVIDHGAAAQKADLDLDDTQVSCLEIQPLAPC